MALTLENAIVDSLRDEQYAVECRGVSREDCMRHGDLEDVCTGCPAWEALKQRVAAKLAGGEEPGRSTP
jgi:hypothetical protein